MTSTGAIRGEEGAALITVLLVAFVMILLSSTVVLLSTHNTEQSADDRSRVAAVAAAEAGIDRVFADIESSEPDSLPCAASGALRAAPLPSSYDVAVTYFSDAAAVACPPPAGGPRPTAARIRSQGSAGSTTPRTMEAQVDLAPKYGVQDFAIFSDEDLGLVNSLTLNGDEGDDADVYTNGSLDVSNSADIRGSLYAQGSITLGNSGTVYGSDVWANGPVGITNTRQVRGAVTSSTSTVTLRQEARIDPGGAKAGTTVDCLNPNESPCPSSRIAGPKVENTLSPRPPQRTLPQITGDVRPWQDLGYTVFVFPTFAGASACAEAKAFIDGWLPEQSGQRRLVRISEVCALEWRNNATVSIRNDLAILTDGSVYVGNNVNFAGPAGRADLHLMTAYRTGLTCSGGLYDVTKDNLSTFVNLDVLLYSPCTVHLANNSASPPFTGQVIAGTVDVTNRIVMDFARVLAPGTAIDGFKQNIRYKREIRNDQ